MKSKALIGMFAALTVLSACQKKAEPIFPAFSADEISAEAVWERISVDYSYQDYACWPGHDGIRPGQAPHGALHRIFINKTLLEALPATDSVAPYGSIIEKDNLNASRDLEAITVMVKVKDFNPEAGDWFWAKYGADGSVQAEGKPGGCIGCHEGLRDNDYVIVQMLDKPLRD